MLQSQSPASLEKFHLWALSGPSWGPLEAYIFFVEYAKIGWLGRIIWLKNYIGAYTFDDVIGSTPRDIIRSYIWPQTQVRQTTHLRPPKSSDAHNYTKNDFIKMYSSILCTLKISFDLAYKKVEWVIFLLRPSWVKITPFWWVRPKLMPASVIQNKLYSKVWCDKKHTKPKSEWKMGLFFKSYDNVSKA